MAPKDTDLKARNLIIVSLLLAILLLVSYYYSIIQSEEEKAEEQQPYQPYTEIIEPESPAASEEPAAQQTPGNKAEEPAKEQETKEFDEVLIKIENFRFIPKEVNITVGTTVVWKNLDMVMGDVRPHVIAAHFNEFRSGRLLINDTFYHTFTKVGSYTYRDAIFSSKMGTARINVIAKETGMGSITGNVLGFNKSTAASGLAILLVILIFIGLYNERKVHLIVHHKYKNIKI